MPQEKPGGGSRLVVAAGNQNTGKVMDRGPD